MKNTLKILSLITTLAFSQNCYPMVPAIGRTMLSQFGQMYENFKPIQSINLLNSITCIAFIYIAFKYKSKRGFVKYTGGTSVGSINKVVKIIASIPLCSAALLVGLMKMENMKDLQQAGLSKDVFVINTCAAFFGIINALLLDYYEYVQHSDNKPLIITSKIDFDADFIDKHYCLICMDKLKEPINPCVKNDHLFCKECLTSWFKNNESIAKKHDQLFLDFKCTACTKEITIDNPKVSINRLEVSPISVDFMKSLAGFKGVLLVLFACNICYLVFLAAT